MASNEGSLLPVIRAWWHDARNAAQGKPVRECGFIQRNLAKGDANSGFDLPLLMHV
jgi:hypothetical protein